MTDLKKTGSAEPELASVSLSSPDKVMFAEAGTTKLQLAEYLIAASGRMLPHITGRPLSFVRCPEGTAGECFFQKHTAKGMPKALRAVPVKESDGETADYLMIDDVAGLASAAQIGALEIHIWGSHWKTIEHPDRLVFDLDPDGGVSFADVRTAAREVRDLLAAAELQSFALVTGGKGIHVVVPLDASQEWDTIKTFAKGVAVKLAQTEPQRFTATMSKEKRRGRIFIDWLRNERGSTAIAPYSPRARATASVAVPLTWDELSRVEHANQYSIDSVLKRLAQLKSDPWAGYFDLSQRISREAARFFA